MPLSTGTRLGPYEIVSTLGAGGMGEVYRARDAKLNRDVALKILPEAFSLDSDRLARFRREAQVLASLNHPNIGAIYGFEESNGTQALVLELVEGPTLADRIAQGALPLDEGLLVAKQIAEALEAAHDQGIIHRDLKPGNIKLRPDGKVKVLDFGLAKLGAAEASGAAVSAGPSPSPTITSPALMTAAGLILGTAAYMSPEQAKGKPADKRCDIWAFGCVLYEMLTANRPFDGDDVSDTLANVLKTAPDWSALPKDLPPAVVAVIKRCLEKDPNRRISHVSALLFVLDDPLVGSAKAAIATSHAAQPDWRRSRMTWAIAGTMTIALIATSVVALQHFFESPARLEPVEFTIAPPDKSSFGGPVRGAGTGVATQLSISPDGQHVVFVASGPDGFVLWLRSLGTSQVRMIAGTEGASFPFWSPDSRSIGFFAGEKLKRVQLSGGPPVILCDAPAGRGGTWNAQNVIVFARSNNGILQRVSGAGGTPENLFALDESYGEINHRFPSFLPDGEHFFYTAVTGAATVSPKPSRIKIGALASNESTVLMEAESSAAYSSGHLFFIRNGTLMAEPFDPALRQAVGDPFPVAERLSTEGSRYASFAISANGVLVYAHGEGTIGGRTLTWRDRAGKLLGQVGDMGLHVSLALSRDEHRVAFDTITSASGLIASDIWTIDIARNLSSRLTFDAGNERSPVWSPDGSRVAFQTVQVNERGIHLKSSAGTGADEPLLQGSTDVADRGILMRPSDFSADGRFLAYAIENTAGNGDIWIVPLSGDRKPFVFVATPFNENHPMFSPDGRWMAYTSFDSGRPQVYVQPFPQTGDKKQISRDGGSQPMWRGDGRELYFLATDGTMMVATVTARMNEIDPSVPQPLFASGVVTLNTPRQYAVTKDGQRFLINAPQSQQPNAMPLTVVVNWPATVKH